MHLDIYAHLEGQEWVYKAALATARREADTGSGQRRVLACALAKGSFDATCYGAIQRKEINAEHELFAYVYGIPAVGVLAINIARSYSPPIPRMPASSWL